MPNRYLGTKSLFRALFDGGTFRRSPMSKSPLRESSKHCGFASAPRGPRAVLVDNRGSGDLGNRAPLRSSASTSSLPFPLARNGSLSASLHSAALSGHSWSLDGFEGSERCHQVGELHACPCGCRRFRRLDSCRETSLGKFSSALAHRVLSRASSGRCRRVSRQSLSLGRATWPFA